MKRFLLFLLVIPWTLLALAQNVISYSYMGNSINYDGIMTYVGGVGEVRVSSRQSNTLSGDLVIPEKFIYNGCEYTVIGIERDAFSDQSSITSVVLPNSIKYIYDCAFSRCTSMTSINIPGSVGSIADNVFNGCSALTSISLPSSLTRIGRDAFKDCKGLTSVEIPDNVTEIKDEAFCGCTALNTVILPLRLEKLGSAVFETSKNIRNVVFCGPTPIEGSAEVFDAEVYKQGILYVRNGFESLFATSSPWKFFVKITGKEFTPNINKRLIFNGIIGYIGETVDIEAEVLPADVTDPTINWTSSNPEVAAVDSEGKVWFNAAGNATVTAECQGLDFSVPFVVKEVVARALNVFPVEAVGGIGHEFSLLALHEPENTTDKSVTWESSNPEVASVSEDGRVQLAALGSAQITARSGEHTAHCSVTVSNDIGNLTEMASTGVVIDIVEGGIVVRNAPVGEMIAVYAADGKAVNGAIVESDETRLALAPGIYVVKVSPATVAKVLIKL